ncbi:hypothetical protein DDW11_03845 [Sulfolobus sp. SCGC AB-777_G06]|nr:hypothetical protein DDW11_03845 [Sulfolobus sp. SCGC AB-777_G06]
MRLIYTILVIAIILAFTFAYFLFYTYNNINSNEQRIVQSSSEDFTLYLKLNTTKISPGKGIAIVVELFYDGINPVYINVSNTIIHLPSPYPCGSQFLVGLEVFKGYYTISNISLAKPLLLYNPAIYLCVMMPPVAQYKLLPLSDQIQLIYSGKVQATLNDEISISINGYWIINSTGINHTFFQPGVYTVEAVDYFNQTILGYFTVT